MRPFDFYAPSSLSEATAFLHQYGERARAIAGGTDIVVQMKENRTRFAYPDMVVSLARISELKGIDFVEGQGLRIGAGSTLTEIASHPDVQSKYPALDEGAGVVGSLQTMNMGTIGGNICNAAPSADTVPALMVYEAEAVIVNHDGRRSVPIAEVFRGPGMTVLAPGELLAELRLPVPPVGTGASYVRHTPRKQMDIAVVGVAAALTVAGGSITSARIALGAVAPTPVRAPQAESLLQGREASEAAFAEAAEAAGGECSPISDIRGSADFRRHLVKVLTVRMLAEAANRAANG